MKKGPFLLNQASLKPKGEVTLALTVTTPTHDLTSNKYLHELIHSYTSYQLIPSIPKTQLFDVEEAIISIIPLSRNRLIDVAMPYIYQEKNKLDEKYFGRYLIFNQQLIGIRLCCYKTNENAYPNTVIQRWPAGKLAYHRVPKRILDYYRNRQTKDQTFKKEIPVGDFILNFINAKIGLIFESQYKEDLHILNHYKRAGCQIISVISDLPRDKITHNTLQGSTYKTNSAFETALKKFCRSTDRIVMYAGVRMAPMGELYLSLSFVLQKQMTQKATEPHMFNDGGSITTVCSLPRITQTQRREGTIEEIGFNQIQIRENLIFGGNIRVGKTEYRTAFVNKVIEPRPITRELTDIYRKLSIWYLHKEINQGQPLAFILPLTPKTRLMTMDIKAIAKYMDTRPDQMLVLIKNNKFYAPLEEEQSLDLYVYEDIKGYCDQYPNKKLYFYTDDESEIKFLTEKALINPNIRLCHKLLPFQPPTALSKLQEQRFRKMDKFAQKIINDRIISFSRILIESKDPTWNFNKDDILEAIQSHLKIKLRIQIRQHPFFSSLLKKEKSEIEKLLSNSQIQLFNNNDASIYQLWEKSKLEKEKDVIEIEDETDPKERQEKDRQFWNKMKEQRKMRKQQEKKIYVTCHRCNSFIEKPCVLRCRKCEFMTCYMCIQLFNPDKIKTRSDFIQNCIVCSDVCKCQVCKKRTQRGPLASVAQSHTNLSMMEEQKQGDREKENQDELVYKESCTACMIMGRTSMNIKVFCDKCDKYSCILCIRDKQKNTNFMKEWLCQDCRPPELPRLITESFIPLDSIENGMKQNLQKRQSNKSPSRSGSPLRSANNNRMEEQKPTNGYNNDRGNWNGNGDSFRGRGRGRGRGGNFNSNSNFRNDNNPFNRNNSNQNERKSASRSNSPVRNGKRKSPSNSASPSRVVNTSIKKAEVQRRSPSRSNSPIINRNKSKEQNKRRSPSDSVSPIRNKRQSEQSPKKNQNRKKSRSNSNSGTPPKRKKQEENKKKDEKKRHSSPSRSNSPVRNIPNGNRKRSNSRSRSRSNDKKQKQGEKHFQKPLWKHSSNGSNGNRNGPSDFKNGNSYNNGNNDRSSYNRNGNGNGNYRGSNNNNFTNNSRGDNDKNRSYDDNRKTPGQIIPMNNTHIEEENDIDY